MAALTCTASTLSSVATFGLATIMKQLRILTGIHAGATAALGHGLHRIDADDDADIRITGRTSPSAIVEVGDNDVVTVRRLAARES